jgi:hypothetical protein
MPVESAGLERHRSSIVPEKQPGRFEAMAVGDSSRFMIHTRLAETVEIPRRRLEGAFGPAV